MTKAPLEGKAPAQSDRPRQAGDQLRTPSLRIHALVYVPINSEGDDLMIGTLLNRADLRHRSH
jgi:hypothetical protein